MEMTIAPLLVAVATLANGPATRPLPGGTD